MGLCRIYSCQSFTVGIASRYVDYNQLAIPRQAKLRQKDA